MQESTKDSKWVKGALKVSTAKLKKYGVLHLIDVKNVAAKNEVKKASTNRKSAVKTKKTAPKQLAKRSASASK